MKKCSRFEWIDQYVDRLQLEGHIDLSDAATREQIFPSVAVERPNFSSDKGEGWDRAVPAARNVRIAERGSLVELPVEAELNEELKKIKKLLRQMVDLQQQANLMARGFYGCIIALFVLYVALIHC